MVPPDEGDELFDWEGDELISWKQVQEEESDEEENSETEGQDSTVPIIMLTFRKVNHHLHLFQYSLQIHALKIQSWKRCFIPWWSRKMAVDRWNIDSLFTIYEQFQKKIMLPQEGALRRELLEAKSKLKDTLVVRPQKKKLQMI